MKKLTKEELLAKILDKVVPHLSGCWIYYYSARTSRYGQIEYKRKKWLVHRLVFKLHFPLQYKEELNILHKCDNTFCVNPNHLFIGTQFDNINDMIDKGRRIQDGTMNFMSTLTEDQVKEIRNNGYCDSGINLAKKYNVSPATISNIINKVTYKNS